MNAEDFNAAHAIGTAVLFWPGMKLGEGRISRTRTPSWTIGDNDAVVSVEGYPGGIALTHIEVLPALLDGLPAVAAAVAERAKEADAHGNAHRASVEAHLAFARGMSI